MSETRTEHHILFVDDEEKTRKYFSRLYGHAFSILLASDGHEGLEMFRQNIDTIGVVVTDQKMPNMTGSELLAEVAKLKPSCVRILSTAYADIDAAIDSVNEGGIYRYVTKPWEVSDLEVTLSRAMDLFQIEQDRGELQKQTRSNVEVMASTDRLLTIATLAVIANGNLRNIDVALKALVSLSRVEDLAEDDTDGVDAREFYRRHLSFVQDVRRTFPDGGLATASLDYTQSQPASEVLSPLVDTDSFFEWMGGGSASSPWPGPAELAQTVIRPLLDALKSLMRDTGILLIKEADGGVNFMLPSRILAQKLTPLRRVCEEAASPDALVFAAALFRLANAGASLDISPDQNRAMTCLRVTFSPDQQTNPDSPTGWGALISSLSNQGIYWD